MINGGCAVVVCSLKLSFFLIWYGIIQTYLGRVTVRLAIGEYDEI